MSSSGKSDLIRKRLSSAGLSSEDADKYTTILRAFLAARMTKVKFETEMLKVIPREKISVHNGIIRELLVRAQQKRDGVPDLPLVTPIADRATARPARERPSASGAATAPPRADRATAASRKRQREREDDAEGRPVGAANAPATKQNDPSVPDATGRRGTEKPKSSVDSGRTGGGRGSGAGGARGGAVTAPRPSGAPVLSGTDIATYNVLQFAPSVPGMSVDLDTFLKLRQRMKERAVEHMGMSSVKDDAVALVLLATEMHVKSLMEAGARQRAARQATRPHSNAQCGPVLGHDFREAALRNSSILGDDVGLELERLSLLLY